MSNINTILKNIAKAEKLELANHKVELALIDDIKKLNIIASKSIDTFLNTFKIIVAQKDKAISTGESYYKTAAEIEKSLKEFETKAKAIGIDPNENNDYKSAKELLIRYDIQAVFNKVDSLRTIK